MLELTWMSAVCQQVCIDTTADRGTVDITCWIVASDHRGVCHNPDAVLPAAAVLERYK